MRPLGAALVACACVAGCASTPQTSLDLPEIEGSSVGGTVTLIHDFSPYDFKVDVSQHTEAETWGPEEGRLIPTVADIEGAGEADLQLHEVEGEQRVELIIDLDGVVFDATSDGTTIPDGVADEQAEAVARRRVTTEFTISPEASVIATDQTFAGALYLIPPGYGPAFPADPVAPGDSWDEAYQLDLGGASFAITATHVLEDVLAVAGRRLALVASDVAASDATVNYADLPQESLEAIVGEESGLTELFREVSVHVVGLQNSVRTWVDVDTGRVARQEVDVGPIMRITSFPEDVALTFFAAPAAFDATETQDVRLVLDDGTITGPEE